MKNFLSRKIIFYAVIIVCMAAIAWKIAATKLKSQVISSGSYQIIHKDYGVWGKFRPPFNQDQPPDQQSALASLSYLQGYHPAPRYINVTTHNPNLTYPGLTFYTSGHGPEAFLMDMQGNVIHQWRFDIRSIWPDKLSESGGNYWAYAKLFENGNVLAVFKGSGAIEIDKDSQLIWAYPCACHHNATFDNQGNLYFQTIRTTSLGKDTIYDHAILILDQERNFVKEISLLSLIKKLNNPILNEQIQKIISRKNPNTIKMDKYEIDRGDAFHMNTLSIFDGTLEGQSPLFKKGNALICIRNLGIIAIVDLNKEEIVWFHGPGPWSAGLHDATLLANGHILLFDNYFAAAQSRVLEFDPLTKKITWEYQDPGNIFFSEIGGLNQRLSNGNTIIVETANGRAFEVTKDGQLAWEFYNPHHTGEDNELIATIPSLIRLPLDFPLDWLKQDTQKK